MTERPKNVYFIRLVWAGIATEDENKKTSGTTTSHIELECASPVDAINKTVGRIFHAGWTVHDVGYVAAMRITEPDMMETIIHKEPTTTVGDHFDIK